MKIGSISGYGAIDDRHRGNAVNATTGLNGTVVRDRATANGQHAAEFVGDSTAGAAGTESAIPRDSAVINSQVACYALNAPARTVTRGIRLTRGGATDVAGVNR